MFSKIFYRSSHNNVDWLTGGLFNTFDFQVGGDYAFFMGTDGLFGIDSATGVAVFSSSLHEETSNREGRYLQW